MRWAGRVNGVNFLNRSRITLSPFVNKILVKYCRNIPRQQAIASWRWDKNCDTLCVSWGRFAWEAAGPQLRLRQLSESPPSPLLRQIHMAAGRLLTEVLTCFSQTRIPAGKYSGQSHPDKQHWNLNHDVFKSIRLKFNTINNWQSLHKLCYENICGPIFLTISVSVPGHYWNDSLQFPFPNFGKRHFSFPPHSQTSGMGEFW